jgi:Fe2+ or Zn2+ uptake regulation protein
LYTQWWKDLTTVQQKTLLAVIQQDGRGLLATKVTHGIGKGASTIKRALTALLARDILREEEQTGAIRYRFEDPFFAHWLRFFTLH